MKETYITTISTKNACFRRYFDSYELATEQFNRFIERFEELKKIGECVYYVNIAVFKNGVNCACETIKTHF